MSIPSNWCRTVARSAGTSGKRMALVCARGVYEAVDRRMPEAAALANWLRQSATAFGLADPAIPDDDTPRRSRGRGVPMPDWRKIGSALTSAEAALPDNANAPRRSLDRGDRRDPRARSPGSAHARAGATL